MFLTILTFIIILGILVLVHELGHFFTARASGIKIEEFGLGLPPRIVGIRRVNKKIEIVWGKKLRPEEIEKTIYSINWLPLGGFVKIKGEDGSFETDKDSFGAKAIWKRITVLASGVTMNIILAIVLLSAVFAMGVPTVVSQDEVMSGLVENTKIQVVEVLPDSPAQKANIQSGDAILGAGDVNFTNIDTLKDYFEQKESKKITLQIERADKNLSLEITPEKVNDIETVGIGVGLIQTGITKYPVLQAVEEGFRETIFLVKEITKAIGKAITSIWSDGESSLDVAGPVGIAVLTGQVVHLGIIYVLQFAALLSINLAIINILPFPALDGGRIVFLIIEKLKGSPVNPRIESWVHNVGMWILILAIIGVTARDVINLF